MILTKDEIVDLKKMVERLLPPHHFISLAKQHRIVLAEVKVWLPDAMKAELRELLLGAVYQIEETPHQIALGEMVELWLPQMPFYTLAKDYYEKHEDTFIQALTKN